MTLSIVFPSLICAFTVIPSQGPQKLWTGLDLRPWQMNITQNFIFCVYKMDSKAQMTIHYLQRNPGLPSPLSMADPLPYWTLVENI